MRSGLAWTVRGAMIAAGAAALVWSFAASAGVRGRAASVPRTVGFSIRPGFMLMGKWSVVPDAAPRKPGDVDVSIAFEVRTPSRRGSMAGPEIRAVPLSADDAGLWQTSRQTSTLKTQRELVANEVVRRTGLSECGDAVRNLGEWQSLAEGRHSARLLLGAVGVALLVAWRAVPLPRSAPEKRENPSNSS